MEENLLLKQPTDPRLVSDLPDLPPGTEMDDFEAKKSEKETATKKSTRRSSPSPKRKSPSHSRSRRSPTPPTRRNRYRYSPDRRGSRFDRRRSPPPRDRYRGRGPRRGHSSSRSRSRSASPVNRRGGRSRWSPKKKPKTPTPPPPQLSMPSMDASKLIMTSAPPPPNAQFNVMQAPPPPQLYSAEPYAGYGQTYNAFGQQPNAYAGNYNPGYAAQPNWNAHDAYSQQGWIQNTVPNQPNQMPQNQPVEAGNFSNNNVNQAHVVPSGTSDSSAHDAAVAQEAENQRDELKKQRSSYIQKNSVLKKELKMLKDQRKDLDSGAAPPSPTTKGFIDENEKLQNQIIKKIATIDNVIEMLTGVIGEEHVEQDSAASLDSAMQRSIAGVKTTVISKLDSRAAKKTQQQRTTSTSSNSSDGSHTSDSSSSSSTESSSSTDDDEADSKKKSNNKTGNGSAHIANIKQEDDDDDDSSPERLKHKVIESMKSKQRTLSANALKDFPSLAEKVKTVAEPEQIRFNYAFYDPEMHWCQKCDVFPKTAKDYLKHLHSKEHMEKENASETPWHANLIEDNFPTYENVQTKRMPIRGITFFTPATAWFCKLCSAWMGDLHCASVHLKSKQHSSKYTAFLERNPNFEMNWLADRQRVLNEKNFEAAASQITAVSTTAAEERESKKSKKSDEKSSKKHKKNTDKKNKKKKKKQKKRKKVQDSSSDSSNSESSSSEDVEEKHAKKKKKIQKLMSPIKDLNNPNPAASIRLAMRKAESSKNEMEGDEQEVPPPPPPISMTITNTNAKRPLGNWTLAQEGNGKPPSSQEPARTEVKSDDTIIQQWNSVQPVISDNEKKLLEQLKGKLKTTKPTSFGGKDTKDVKDNDKFDGNKSRESRLERTYRGKRSRTRSPTRSRSRGRDWRRARSRSLRRRSRSRGRRSRTRSRGRYSPVRGGRRRFSRSRSRRRRSRSRSRNRRGRRTRTRSRSASRSGRGSPSAALTSASRIEKPVIPHSEFRPRVPEKEKEKEKKIHESKDKKDSKKATKSVSTSSVVGKKLPFIGKMPVFKKQATGQTELETTEAASTVAAATTVTTTDSASGVFITQTSAPTAPTAPPRPPAPTAEQIKMAMMEDVYGNAPPFHPDVGVMHQAMDYEDLMPDPVQFVNLMSQAPPAPPPPPIEDANDVADMLPPGIDENEMENDQFSAKPAPESGDNDALPKDFEEALNIIFPGERNLDGDDEDDSQAAKESTGETQIIVEQPVMQMDELYKEGIHMVSIEETSVIAMDEASQLSMNEPLVFNNSVQNAAKQTSVKNSTAEIDAMNNENEPLTTSNENSNENENNDESALAVVEASEIRKCEESETNIQPTVLAVPDSIPMPPPSLTDSHKNDCPAIDLNLDDIPHPPAPLSESEKQRRQEELDDLAMLGIDADDMAAQCM